MFKGRDDEIKEKTQCWFSLVWHPHRYGEAAELDTYLLPDMAEHGAPRAGQ